MKIRIGTEKDIESVSTLWLEMANELSPSESPDVQWWKDIAHSVICSGMYYMFVLSDEEKDVGFSDLYIVPEPLTGKYHCMGRHLYVRPRYRNTIWAGLLYKRYIEMAKILGTENIELTCAPKEFNKWTSKGYTVVGLILRKS